MTQFITTNSLPKAKPKEKSAEKAMPSHIDQIHEMVKNGHDLPTIHRTIDNSPTAYNKDALKAYAANVHKLLTEHYGKIKK